MKKHKSLNKKKIKPTGELAFFQSIWQESDTHNCFICSDNLDKYIDTPFFVNCFSHNLSKGSHPEHRLNKENITLLCPSCHNLYHYRAKSDLLLSPGWKDIFDKCDMLKQKNPDI
jgi:hypothetical protein